MEGLIPSISTQDELNEFELLNIFEGVQWARRSRNMRSQLLAPDRLNLLHKQMFGKTWRWAGRYRLTEKSIGVEAYRISTELHNLCEDAIVWIQFRAYEPRELAARFHHRLVVIHPYVNGNGRLARAATDLLCQRQGWAVSAWGATNRVGAGKARAAYLHALRQADLNNFELLVKFMGD
ncbi:mobile mystery protein B [soil metagenome]